MDRLTSGGCRRRAVRGGRRRAEPRDLGAPRVPARPAVRARARDRARAARGGSGRRPGRAARDRVRLHGRADHLGRHTPEEAMSNTRKVLLGVAAFYVLGIILLAAIFGVTQHKNNEFQVQNEFKLINWISLGLLSINRAVLYLFLSSILTVITMVFIADRMKAR